MSHVKTHTEGPIFTLTLSRPDRLNALTFSMLNQMVDHLSEAGANPDIRAIIINGEGKAFCAGDDLVNMGTDSDPIPESRIEEYHRGYPRVVEAIRRCPTPVVVSMHGYTLGAGLEISLAADLLIAAEDTKIGLPFILRGFASGTTLLPRLSNRIFASRLLFGGEIVSVAELERFGLLHERVPQAELVAASTDAANHLAQLPTKSIGLMKAALRHSESLDEQSALYLQAHSTVSSALTADFQEGRAAFQEKREPRFQGH